jgi:hypothetical protein
LRCLAIAVRKLLRGIILAVQSSAAVDPPDAATSLLRALVVRLLFLLLTLDLPRTPLSPATAPLLALLFQTFRASVDTAWPPLYKLAELIVRCVLSITAATPAGSSSPPVEPAKLVEPKESRKGDNETGPKEEMGTENDEEEGEESPERTDEDEEEEEAAKTEKREEEGEEKEEDSDETT